MANTTAQAITFSLRKLVIQPLNNAGGVTLGQPLVIDTPESAELKWDVSLEDVRGGAYLPAIAADAKEMKIEISTKLTDCPPTLGSLLLAGSYNKNSSVSTFNDNNNVSGTAVANVIGATAGSRCTITAVTAGTASGLYAIVATGPQAYQVYPFASGTGATAVTTSNVGNTTDTASVAGVTITTGFSPVSAFVSGDVANFEIVNIGGSGNSADQSMETITGWSSYPVTIPQVQIIADATRRGQIYQFVFYSCEFEGVTLPFKQGGFVVPDFKARVLQPSSGLPYRWRRIS